MLLVMLLVSALVSGALEVVKLAALHVLVSPLFWSAALGLVYVALIRGHARREVWFKEAVDAAFWIAEGAKGQSGVVGTAAQKADAALAALQANAALKGESLSDAEVSLARAAWAAASQKEKAAVK